MEQSIIVSQNMPIMTIADSISRYNALVEFVKGVMNDGVDFGVIPGTDKPTLLKPGAEKLCTLFGLMPRFAITEKIMEWGDLEHEPLFYFAYKCSLMRGDFVMAEGEGSCNSREKKYRYRSGERRCPTCGRATIIKGKAEYGGGWLCFQKKGGCGAKFAENDKAIIDQQVGQIYNPDIADQINTIQKMAQKRALIAATLIAVNASEFFTQDVEDMATIEGEYTTSPEEPVKHPASQPTKQDRRDADLEAQIMSNVQQPDPEHKAEAPRHPAKKCTSQTAHLSEMFAEIQKVTPYYNGKDGKVNGYHALGAAAKYGYEFVTDENIEHVKRDLIQYAQEQQALAKAIIES